MSHERVGLLLEKPTQKAVDSDLFHSLQAVLGGVQPAYRQLQLEGESKVRAASALHEGECPDMTAQHLDQSELSTRLSDLREWKRELVAREDIDPVVKQAYRWRVNEEMAQVHMIRASQAGDMRSFRRWSEFIYGKPNEQIYKAALDWIATDADTILSKFGSSSSQGEAAQAVLDAFGDMRGDKSILTPDEETFAAVRDDHISEGGTTHSFWLGLTSRMKARLIVRQVSQY